MPSQTMALMQSQRLQMVLAPQLRQSLEMLQLPILELRAMVQQELEQNPTIEETPIETERVEIEPGTGETEEKQEMDFDKEYEALASLDEEWRDYFFQSARSSPYSEDQAEKRQFLLDSIPQRESLQEHLVGQLHLSGLSDEDQDIGELIIGSISDDGYLTSSLDHLAETTGMDLRRLQDVLMVVQEFHPTGVGAQDVRECLLIQLERIGKGDTLAADVVRDHLEALAARKLPDIAKALNVKPVEIEKAAQFIGTLDPKPGRAYSAETPAYVLPEVVVQKVDGEYVIALNDDQLPHVRISRQYRRLLEDPTTKPEVRTYVQERIRSGVFLIKSIHQRQRTIDRISTEIIKSQNDFLDHGVSHLKPLTMAEIAKAVGVHETTVSRAVAGKYMKTPKGVFELKYFFTPGIRTSDGKQVSNKTVKDMIAGMVAGEELSNPLSDQEIMEKLRADGIKIARRTIAKYRLILRIPPSHMRKKY